MGGVFRAIGKIFGIDPEPPVYDQPYNQNLLTNETAPTSHIGVVYGFRRKAGVRIGTFVKGDDNEYLYAVYALSHGPIQDISNPRMDDVSFSDRTISAYVDWSYGLGGDAQDATTDRLIAELGTSWDTVNGKLGGVAFAIVKLTLNEDHMTSFGNITFDVQGRLVFDPRTPLDDPKWSDNPALCALDYQNNTVYGKRTPYPQGFNATTYIDAANYFDEVLDDGSNNITSDCYLTDAGKESGYIVANGGLFANVTAGEIYDVSGFANPADNFRGVLVAKEQVHLPSAARDDVGVDPDLPPEEVPAEYKLFFVEAKTIEVPEVASGYVSITYVRKTKRYTCNGNVDTSQNMYDNLRALSSSFNGHITFFEGVSTIIPDRPEATTGTFDESNITSDIEVQLPDKKSQLNELTGTWFDPEFGYDQMTKTVSSEVFLSRDGGRVQSKELAMPFTNNPNMVDRILTIDLNKSRHSGPVRFSTFWSGLEVFAGGTIKVSDVELGWVNRKFRVIRIGIPDIHNDVSLTCIPYDADDYIEGEINPRKNKDYVNYSTKGNFTLPTVVQAVRKYGSEDIQATVSWVMPANVYFESVDLEVHHITRDQHTNEIASYFKMHHYKHVMAASKVITEGLTVGGEYEFRVYVRGVSGQRSLVYAFDRYVHSNLPRPQAVGITTPSPWTVSAIPEYSETNAEQRKLNHYWYLAEYIAVNGEPTLEDHAVMVHSGPSLIWAGLKPNTPYRLWVVAYNDFEEAEPYPTANGESFTTPTSDGFVTVPTPDLALTSDAQIFIKDSTGVVTPDKIEFTALKDDSVTDPVTWSTSPSVILDDTDPAGPLTKELTKENFGTNSAVQVTITAGSLTDTITVLKLESGQDSVTGFLTNEVHTIAADSDGVITGNLGLAGGEFKVYQGTTDVTASCTFSIKNSSEVGLTASIASSSGVYVISDVLDDEAVVVFEALYSGTTISKQYSISKAIQGDKGDDGVSYTGTTEWYKRTNSITAPSDGGESGTGWSQDATNLPPTSSNQYLWNYNVSTKSVGAASISSVHLIAQYSSDGAGIDTIVESYQRSASATSAPTGTWHSTFSGAGTLSNSYPYMWNKTVITFTQGKSSETKYTLIAAKGADGYAPIKGVDYFDGAGTYTLESLANVSLTPNSATAIIDTTWGAGARTKESHLGASVASCTTVRVNALMFGLSSLTSTSPSYGAIDYAIYRRTDDTYAVYESGSNRGVKATGATDSDVISVVNTGNKIKYLVNGVEIYESQVTPSGSYHARMSFGNAGNKCENITFSKSADSLLTQFSTSGTSGWTQVYDSLTHEYFRQSNDGGLSWGSAIKFRGEDGAKGVHSEVWFKRLGSKPPTPTGNEPSGTWYDAPPSGSNQLWACVGDFDADDNLIGVWTVIQFEGIDGESAISGGISASNGLAFSKNKQGVWSPSGNTTLTATFYKDGVQYGPTISVVVTRSNGNLTSNASGINNASSEGEGTAALTITFTEVTTGMKISEKVITVQDGSDGGKGDQGGRGAGHFYGTASSWDDAIATAATEGDNVIGDRVTLSNGSTYVQTKYWNGSSWISAGTVIDGNLVINGEAIIDNLAAGYITASKIDVGTLNLEEANWGSSISIYESAKPTGGYGLAYVNIDVPAAGSGTAYVGIYVDCANSYQMGFSTSGSIVAEGDVNCNRSITTQAFILDSLVVGADELGYHGEIEVRGANGRVIVNDNEVYHAGNPPPSSSMSATDILNLLKTVDGSGSGLDADRLDNHSASHFPKLASTNYFTSGTNFFKGIYPLTTSGGFGTEGYCGNYNYRWQYIYSQHANFSGNAYASSYTCSTTFTKPFAGGTTTNIATIISDLISKVNDLESGM